MMGIVVYNRYAVLQGTLLLEPSVRAEKAQEALPAGFHGDALQIRSGDGGGSIQDIMLTGDIQAEPSQVPSAVHQIKAAVPEVIIADIYRIIIAVLCPVGDDTGLDSFRKLGKKNPDGRRPHSGSGRSSG